jgi:NADH:ubiquinone oxidoreductase subunit 5 (subunit L)/multisubunit Na+/H+ antiporter MnhA subunit
MVLLAISLPTVFIPSSKSAQYPSSPRLLSATSAPTPISSLSHPPTTVTSGVHSGLITDPLSIITTNSLMWFFILLLLSIILSLIIPSSKAIPSSDTKPTTAYPTTSQTSHMFPRLSSIPHHAPHHIIVHGPFKSSLSLLSGSLIHVQLNLQSIHKMKPNNLMIKISSILGVCVLILSLSKEGIIIYCNILSFSFILFISIISILFSLFYCFKSFLYCFYIFSFGIYFDNLSYSSLISSLSIITPIFIDQCFEFTSSLRNYPLFHSINLERLFTLSVLYTLGSSLSLIFYFGLLFFVVII